MRVTQKILPCIGHYTDQGSYGFGQYDGLEEYWGPSIAPEGFLIFTTRFDNFRVCFFLFEPFSDEPEVFPPKYSQTAILHAAHFCCCFSQFGYTVKRDFVLLPIVQLSSSALGGLFI